ncbi:SDR family oxidoreductase [Streptomyces sp. NPDC056486]|uniref:SDR family oxidoreductase n=1 Tax=Streptomyces sp. NPDC056486 TaxID=3345835 RepID=UPI0036B1744C
MATWRSTEPSPEDGRRSGPPHRRHHAEDRGAETAPMERPGETQDAAELIAFLTSGRATCLTGAQVRVDGAIIPAV